MGMPNMAASLWEGNHIEWLKCVMVYVLWLWDSLVGKLEAME
jgi:hypothetical protein